MITLCMFPEIWSMTDNFLLFWTIFCPFYPFNDPENKNFEKRKKVLGDIITLHMWTKNYDYMMYGS